MSPRTTSTAAAIVNYAIVNCYAIVNTVVMLSYIIKPEDEFERRFLLYAKDNSQSLKTTINAIYRVIDEDTKKEYYIYHQIQECKKPNGNRVRPNDQLLGYHMKPTVEIRTKARRKDYRIS